MICNSSIRPIANMVGREQIVLVEIYLGAISGSNVFISPAFWQLILEIAINQVSLGSLQFELPKSWGDENIAAADGTQIDLYENNLLSSYHIRYGTYGGIAYHVVSSLYIPLYSHFLNCGVWEGNFLLVALMANTSDIHPT